MLRPRLLFITADVPLDGGSGGQIASWRLLEGYARVCEVDVLALAPPTSDDHDDLHRLAERVSVVTLAHWRYARSRLRTAKVLLTATARREPFRIAKFRSSEAIEVIRGWASETPYAFVHCDQLATAPYRQLVPDARAILAEHNIEWQQFAELGGRHPNPVARRLLAADARRTQAWEAEALTGFDHVLTLSEADRGALLAHHPEVAARSSAWPIPVSVAPLPRPAGPPRFFAAGSLASIGRSEGLRWFTQNVWPRVRAALPDARLDVAGADPPRDLKAMHGSDGIRMLGFVDDLEPIMAAAHACVIPLFVGSGVRVKVLEAIARGIPCIGTPVALQGLVPLPGCIEVRGPDEFSAALIRVADPADPAREEAAAGAAELATTHSYEAANAHLEQVLAGIASS